MKRTIAIVGLVATSALMLTACSSSSDTGENYVPPAHTASAAPSETATPAPSESMVGTSPGTWAPVQITQADNGTVIALVPEQAATFADLPVNDANNKIVVVSDNPAVVEALQSTDDGQMQTVAGLQALSVGKAHVIVYDGDPVADKNAIVVMQFDVAVDAATAATDAPAVDGSAAPVASAIASAVESAIAN